jgi:hypothetical protein
VFNASLIVHPAQPPFGAEPDFAASDFELFVFLVRSYRRVGYPLGGGARVFEDDYEQYE